MFVLKYLINCPTCVFKILDLNQELLEISAAILQHISHSYETELN